MLQDTLRRLLHPPPLALILLLLSALYLLPRRHRQRILSLVGSIVGLDLMILVDALPSPTSLVHIKAVVLDPLARILLGWEPEHNLDRDSSLALSKHLHASSSALPDRSKVTSRAQLHQLRHGESMQESILSRSDELQMPDDDIQVSGALLDTIEGLAGVSFPKEYTRLTVYTFYLKALQQPLASPKSFRPRAIVSALEESRSRDPKASGYHSNIMNREQQDAQELFQMISSALSSEEAAVQKLSATRPLLDLDLVKSLLGLGQRSHPNEHSIAKVHSNPMMGLLASRLSCMQCGYTEAIRHFTFDNLSLSLPSTHACTIEDCLKQYVNLESLHDVVCRKCSLLATLSRIGNDLKQLDGPLPSPQQQQAVRPLVARRRFQQDSDSSCTENSSGNDSLTDSGQSTPESDDYDDDDDDDLYVGSSKKTRTMAAVQSCLTKADRVLLKLKLTQQKKVLESAIRSDVERPLEDIKLTKVVSRHCTKQVMLAKPPKVLCLHFIRSQYSNYGTVSKNSCQVNFPEYLDASAFCTSGVLLTKPNLPMSISEQDLERLGYDASRISNHATPKTPLPPQHQQHQGVIYRLQSIVVHYGGHSFGHFIAYRRKPESMVSKVGAMGFRQDPMRTSRAGSLYGSDRRMEDWFRISDESVESVTLDHVLRSNPYMCLYERVETPEEKENKTRMAPKSSLSLQAVELGFRNLLKKNKDQGRGRGRGQRQDDNVGDKVALDAGRIDLTTITEKEYAELFKEQPKAMSALSRQTMRSALRDEDEDEDMSDTKSIHSHDEDRAWRSFVSSPNSTTPPSPNTASSDSSTVSSSLTSPILMQRLRPKFQHGDRRSVHAQAQAAALDSIPDLDLMFDTPTSLSSSSPIPKSLMLSPSPSDTAHHNIPGSGPSAKTTPVPSLPASTPPASTLKQSPTPASTKKAQNKPKSKSKSGRKRK
ncbi:hypothetical protein BGZ99_008295 [Dissophora globulifera]|uniref:ubiquitinyl hydrolase 1 n=1 Tax=Dissophora globulifera TaxID=979702 RepID=A0A9P6RBM8_9FUNG|nr:hypothetical protein BGZ99_008295 [Dissophora globulifera]